MCALLKTQTKHTGKKKGDLVITEENFLYFLSIGLKTYCKAQASIDFSAFEERVVECSSTLDIGTVVITPSERADFSCQLLILFFSFSELHDLPLKIFFSPMKPHFSEVYKAFFVSALITFQQYNSYITWKWRSESRKNKGYTFLFKPNLL